MQRADTDPKDEQLTPAPAWEDLRAGFRAGRLLRAPRAPAAESPAPPKREAADPAGSDLP
jgi:hypothetical protein